MGGLHCDIPYIMISSYYKLNKVSIMRTAQATITSKGQVTIPSYIREKLNLVSGNKLEFVINGNSFVVMPINKSVKSLRGILPKPQKSFTIEEMNEAIKDAYGRD